MPQRRGVVVAVLVGDSPFKGPEDMPSAEERVLLDQLVNNGVAVRLGRLGTRTNSLIADQTRMLAGTFPLASPPDRPNRSMLDMTYDSPRENARLTTAFDKDWAMATTYVKDQKP